RLRFAWGGTDSLCHERSDRRSPWAATLEPLPRLAPGAEDARDQSRARGPLDGGTVEMDDTLVDVVVVDDGAFEGLRAVFGGQLLRSADPGYDAARRGW